MAAGRSSFTQQIKFIKHCRMLFEVLFHGKANKTFFRCFQGIISVICDENGGYFVSLQVLVIPLRCKTDSTIVSVIGSFTLVSLNVRILVMFIDKNVKVSTLIHNDVFQPFIDGRRSMTNLFKNSLQNNHISKSTIFYRHFQHINLIQNNVGV